MASGGRRCDLVLNVIEKTRKLIDRLKSDSDKISLIEDLLGCRPDGLPRSPIHEPLTYLLRSHRDLVFDVVKAEARARIQTHADLMQVFPSPHELYQSLVYKYQHQPSHILDMLTDMLNRVCDVMAKTKTLFAFRPVGVGSHHDGTIVSRCGDVDFVLMSIYRPREGLAYRSEENLTDQPQEDYLVEFVDDNLSPFSIIPVKGSDLHKGCMEQRLLLPGGQLDVSKYRQLLADLLSSVTRAVCSGLGLPFGGWNKPDLGNFENNGPALTVLVAGVSVDITFTFSAPKTLMDCNGKKIMKEIAQKLPSRVSFTVSEEYRPDYSSMGLLVLTGHPDCVLSLNHLDTHLFRMVPKLQSALKICKMYRDRFFDLPWPDLAPYFRHLEGRVLEWLVSGVCDTLMEYVPSDPNHRVIDRLGYQAEALLLLATQRRPLAVHENILEKLETIKQRIGKRIDYRFVDPSLRSLVLNVQSKPLVRTISFVLKCLILHEWSRNKKVAMPELIIKTLMTYSRRLQSSVSHPLLPSSFSTSLWSRPVDVVKAHLFCDPHYLNIKESVLSIHQKSVEQILIQIRLGIDDPSLTSQDLPALILPREILDDEYDLQIEVPLDTRQQQSRSCRH